jgi:cytoskeletal protein CcmA (bactofilin family)
MIWKRDDEGEAQGEAESEPARKREERRMAEGSEVTVVGAGAKLEGTVVSAGSLRVDGQVKGRIDADGDVALSPQSSVEADIHAANVSIAGRFRGNLIVAGKAELKSGGRIEGNITSKVLVIEEGGVFDGTSVMEAKTQAVATPTQPSQPEGRRAERHAQPGTGKDQTQVRVP